MIHCVMTLFPNPPVLTRSMTRWQPLLADPILLATLPRLGLRMSTKSTAHHEGISLAFREEGIHTISGIGISTPLDSALMILSEAPWALALDRAAAACTLPLMILSSGDRLAAAAMILERHLEPDMIPRDRANRHLEAIEDLLVDVDRVETQAEALEEWAGGLEGT